MAEKQIQELVERVETLEKILSSRTYKPKKSRMELRNEWWNGEVKK